jgi:DNA-binding SARP family transcriptional activator
VDADAATTELRHLNHRQSPDPLLSGQSDAIIAAPAPPTPNAASPSTNHIDDHRSGRDTARASIVSAQPSSNRLGVVRVQVLGAPPHLVDSPPDSDTNPPFRPQSRELLAYLVSHPDGVTEDLLFEDVLGDVPGSKVRSRLNTYVYNLQKRMRAVAGPGSYITHTPHERLSLVRERLDCDLWQMRAALQTARTATDPEIRITALQQAIAEYRGPFAGDADYYWVAPVREAIRRDAVRAHITLADLLASSDPAGAANVLTHAIEHDPYNESLYRQAMQAHIKAGAAAAALALYDRLVEALADIGSAPAADTAALVSPLQGAVQHRPAGPTR